MFSPQLGRFINRDPIAYAGDPVNTYAYCGDSPLTRTDPLGLAEHIPMMPQDHHWFPQSLDSRIVQKCPGFDIDKFTTTMTGFETGTAHQFIHYQTWLGNYNANVQRILDSSKDCCEFLGQMITLIYVNRVFLSISFPGHNWNMHVQGEISGRSTDPDLIEEWVTACMQRPGGPDCPFGVPEPVPEFRPRPFDFPIPVPKRLIPRGRPIYRPCPSPCFPSFPLFFMPMFPKGPHGEEMA